MMTHMSPIPIGVYENINFEEHEYFENEIPYELETQWGKRSDTKFVLENTKLKQWIEEQINDYALNCLATNQKLRITQSWCLKNQQKTSQLFRHIHPNSIVSGAYYINCLDNSAPLKIEPQSCFSDNRIAWEKDQDLLKKQPWLWQYYEFPVRKGRLYVFPSNLYHYVDPTIIDNRCVISFNTWFNSPIGSVDNLTYLNF